MPREYPGGFYRHSPSAESEVLRRSGDKIKKEGSGGGQIQQVVEQARTELHGVDVSSLTGKGDKIDRLIGKDSVAGMKRGTVAKNDGWEDHVISSDEVVDRHADDNRQGGGTSTVRGMGPIYKNRRNTNRRLDELSRNG